MATEIDRQYLKGLCLAYSIGIFWSLTLISSLTLDLSQTNIGVVLSLVVLRSFLHTGLFIVAHDAMHGSLAPHNTLLNNRIGYWCLFFYAGLSYCICHRNHTLHHQVPETSADPDFCSPPGQFLGCWYFHFLGNYLGAGQSLALLSIWIGFYAVADVLNSQPGISILLFCVLPLIISSLQLFIFGTWLPHRELGDPCNELKPRSLAIHPLFSFAACYYFSYHSEHHVSPSTPWFKLSSLHNSHLTT